MRPTLPISPTVNNNGTATMTQPLSIPAGRGGFQPDLAATYDSSAASSWLGTGWDPPHPSNPRQRSEATDQLTYRAVLLAITGQF